MGVYRKYQLLVRWWLRGIGVPYDANGRFLETEAPVKRSQIYIVEKKVQDEGRTSNKTFILCQSP